MLCISLYCIALYYLYIILYIYIILGCITGVEIKKLFSFASELLDQKGY